MTAIRDYAQLAKDILSEVGGQENINAFSRCATRLRLILKHTPEHAADKIKQMPGVITVVISGGQFQVVIGAHVQDVYQAMGSLVDTNLMQQGKQKVRMLDAVIAAMSAIFAPIVFIMAAAGILQGGLIVAKFFAPAVTHYGAFEVLNFMSWTPFTFLPVLIGYTASKHFNCNPFIAVLCACALINPAWADIAARIAHGEVITFLGLPLAKTVYTSSVLPPIFMVWAMSYVERYAKRWIPAVVSELFTPLVCMLVMVPATLVVIGPLTSEVASLIAAGYNALFAAAPPVAAALIGGVWQVIVIFGVHWGITPVVFANYDIYGHDSFQAFQAIAVISQMAAAFAVAFKTRNTKLKTTGFSAGVTGIFGITEPALYGVTLRLKKPFICGCIGGATGALVASFFGTCYYAFAGLPGLLTVVNAINADNPMSIIGELIGVAVAVVVTTVLVFVVGFEEPAETLSSDFRSDSDETVLTLVAPVKGQIVPLDTVNDETFAGKLLGDGVAIKPTEGLVTAPCDAVVSSVIESQHAVGLTCDNGAEILIHVGLDTVKLNGRFFETLVQIEQQVKTGDPLIRFDKEKIEQEGYDLTTPFIVMNSDEFSFDILDQSSTVNAIEIGQPIMQVA